MLPLRDNVPTRSFPVVTVGLIVANFIVWFWEVGGTPVNEDVARYGYYPDDGRGGHGFRCVVVPLSRG